MKMVKLVTPTGADDIVDDIDKWEDRSPGRRRAKAQSLVFKYLSGERLTRSQLKTMLRSCRKV